MNKNQIWNIAADLAINSMVKADPNVLEIGDRKDLTRELVEEYWYPNLQDGNRVAYRGQDIVTVFYPTVEPLLDEHLGEATDRQECYLAYDPHTDTFIMGFDAWPAPDYCDCCCDDGIRYEYVVFRYDPGLEVLDVLDVYEGPGGFYRRDGALDEVRRKYPDMIELRLD